MNSTTDFGLQNDLSYITATQGGSWEYATSIPQTATTLSTGPLVVGGHYSWPPQGLIHAIDIELQGLGKIKELMMNLNFLTPPPGLNLDHPAVQDGLKLWYQAVQDLRHRHEQLQMLIKLTDETC